MSEEKEGVMRNAMTTRAPGGANKDNLGLRKMMISPFGYNHGETLYIWWWMIMIILNNKTVL